MPAELPCPPHRRRDPDDHPDLDLRVHPAETAAGRPDSGDGGRGTRPGGDRAAARQVPHERPRGRRNTCTGPACPAGDLGMSLRTREPVTAADRAEAAGDDPAVGDGAVLRAGDRHSRGRAVGLRKGAWVDWLANIGALSGLSIPNFWLGIMLILLVSVRLGWLPASGYVSPAGGSLAVDRDHVDAGLRAGQQHRRHADAAHPVGHAGGAEVRLRPHRAGQGHGRTHGAGETRPAQRAGADRHRRPL